LAGRWYREGAAGFHEFFLTEHFPLLRPLLLWLCLGVRTRCNPQWEAMGSEVLLALRVQGFVATASAPTPSALGVEAVEVSTAPPRSLALR
jgi:hypothetical protein